MLKTKDKFFTTFQIEAHNKPQKYQKDLLQFSEFLLTVYPTDTPVGKAERIQIATDVERFIAENELTKEKKSLW